MGTNYYWRNPDGSEGSHLLKISYAGRSDDGMDHHRIAWAVDREALVRFAAEMPDAQVIDEYGKRDTLGSLIDYVEHVGENYHDESLIGLEFS